MSATPSVLLVDDDRDLLRLMAMRVGAAGWEALAAESGREALARLEASRPAVVVTDLRMEGMDGLALFDAINARHPALPVIILTAHGSIPDAVSATRRGVFAFLTKPFEGRELIGCIENAMALSGEAPAESDPEWRREIVTRNPQMEELLVQAKLVAESEACVLVLGPSGSGKELLARAIHRASHRAGQEFVAVNCAAIPETLLESELFGHARGAFTGAARDYPGLFQVAHRGTLFLDEVGDMPHPLQAKILRALQDREVRPVGALRPVPADARVVAATHRDLEAEVRAGRFREDLFYRLNVARLEVPPLARRREDIPLLATRCLARLSASGRKHVAGFAPEALALLARGDWPGNVRQLFNVVEQAYALATSPIIPASLIRNALRTEPARPEPLEAARSRFERDYLRRLLELTQGNVPEAARLAERNRTDFYRLLARHGIEAASFKASCG